MRHAFTREQIKKIIIEELDRSDKDDVEEKVDDLIDSYLSIDEAKRGGFFGDLLKLVKGQPEEKQEEMAEIALLKAQSRRDALKKIGISAAMLGIGLGAGSYLKHLENVATADAREYRAAMAAAQDEFRKKGGYETGVDFANQAEFYLNNFEFSIDELQSVKNFPAGSDEEFIASTRTVPTPYFISYQSLRDKPIPKCEVDRGQDYMNRLTKYFESVPKSQRVPILSSIYVEFAGIGKTGYAGAMAAAVKIKIPGRGIASVQPPEWTILFTFLTNAMAVLDEQEKEQFINRVLSSEESRFFSTEQGKMKAVKYGYEIGKEGGEIDKNSADYKNARELVQRGYNAGVAGKPFPGIPSRGDREKP
jgi:hypothetical protein